MSENWTQLVERVKKADELKCAKDLNVISTELQTLLKKYYAMSSVDLYQFGSRIMGTGTENSDLDIYVVFDGNFFKFSEDVTSDILSKQSSVARALRENKGTWRVIDVINARVPIIIVKHLPTGIECDLNFSHGIAYSQNELVNYLFKLQPIARYLCIDLRYCMKKCSLDKVFRNHIIILLVIFFLQNEKLLPPIEELQRYYSADIGPWISKFDQHATLNSLCLLSSMVVDSYNFNKLKKSFFKYYANFNYLGYIICPYLGVQVPRDDYRSRMPARFQNHVGYVRTRQLFVSRPLIVQDFIQLNQNKAHAITQSELNSFIHYCSKEC